MIFDLHKRTLEKLAYRYHLKNKRRSAKRNWELAEALLTKLENRYWDKNKELKNDKQRSLPIFKNRRNG